MKRCAGCYDNSNGLGRAQNRLRIPDDAKCCPRCGRRAFFRGERIPRTLWPALADEGPDTIDEDGHEIPGVAVAEIRRRMKEV